MLPLPWINALVFEGSPEPLDEDVVHPASLPVHRYLYAGAFQHVREIEARELAALVGVKDSWLAESVHRFLQHVDAKRRIHAV